MLLSDLFQMALYIALIVLLAPPLGAYMHTVYEGRQRWLLPVENVFYAILGTRPTLEQHWVRYALAVLGFNLLGFLVLYGLLRFQDVLPLNPAGQAAVGPALSFNTAVSFITNTNWQSYGGETTLSHLSQMLGLTVQNFLSAATGMAVAVAVIRGFVRKEAETIGNFWADLVRGTLYILLPLSLLAACVLMWQGVPQNMSGPVEATMLEGETQRIAQGPVASQVAIKQLGTNGGGFFAVNSAHPYENPTPLTNFLQMFYILWIGAAFCFLFGRMAGDKRQGYALFWAMLVMFLVSLGVTYGAEKWTAPAMPAPAFQADGNMEGKEVRFGVANSALWATATTAASNGSVNAMHDSFTPLGAVMPMFQMMTGEVIFGGAGSGFYGILLYVVLTVFIAGLMVGRTPEYLGKKIEAREIKLAIIALLAMPFGVLLMCSLSAFSSDALNAMQDQGPHGFSELLYNYSSASANNGSSFAGFNANTDWHNTMLALCMLLGRYVYVVVMLAIAGSLVVKKAVPHSVGTFPTHTGLFIGLLIGFVVIVDGLTFFPVLALGPIAEHMAMLAGTLY
ncbi:MAG: potassium-transporting ATPase subunit KdpA [Alphaproteobacteria bacterium]|nr:potassium-transporting ATPase subunit KdpA [Alphaproteobacteria bacterium]